jgi:hypothetical protein
MVSRLVSRRQRCSSRLPAPEPYPSSPRSRRSAGEAWSLRANDEMAENNGGYVLGGRTIIACLGSRLGYRDSRYLGG